MYAGISCKQAQVVNASRCNKTKTKITPTRLKSETKQFAHAPDARLFSLRIASEHTSRSAQLKPSTALDGAEGFCLSAPFEISSTQTQHRS